MYKFGDISIHVFIAISPEQMSFCK